MGAHPDVKLVDNQSCRSAEGGQKRGRGTGPHLVLTTIIEWRAEINVDLIVRCEQHVDPLPSILNFNPELVAARPKDPVRALSAAQGHAPAAGLYTHEGAAILARRKVEDRRSVKEPERLVTSPPPDSCRRP